MKTTKLFLIGVLTLIGWSIANAQIISTVAGAGTSGFSGDGGLATSAQLNYPFGICVDTFGNLYIGDNLNYRIRKKTNATGLISTIAGTGTFGYSGDGGLATNAKLSEIRNVCVDNSGNVYFADVVNNRVRKIDASSGIITTVAGIGSAGYSGDGGLATNAELYGPKGVFVDGFSNLFIADEVNNRIRKVDAISGVITTIAGDGTQGYSGDGGQAINAKLYNPTGVCLDGLGNIFIADKPNNCIRKVDASSGVISTIAGNGTVGFSGDGGLAINAQLNAPTGVGVDVSGNIYIADFFNNRIRKVDAISGLISTIAGGGNTGLGDGGMATNAELMFPTSVSLDYNGNLFIADFGGQRIRMVTPTTSGIKEGNGSIIDINLYPNPATRFFTVDGITTLTHIKLYDVTGKLVMEKTVSANTIVNTSELSDGIYTLLVESNKGKAVKKVSISK
ncbi:MAG: T9SS type A sorting domain-containing protein [Bacteroidia bacterium]|nr:T9SS type A sorting domain-containing protein [Bacteroidia bacterium]